MRLIFLLLLAHVISAGAAVDVWLDSLDLSLLRQGFGSPGTNVSVTGSPLSIAGKKFERGVGTHAASALWIDLAGGAEQFSAKVGVDDNAKGTGSVVFRVWADGQKIFDSGVMRSRDAARNLEVRLNGAKALLLQVTDGADRIAFDHADWADAHFRVNGPSPKAVAFPAEPRVLLTPEPGLSPRIHGPKVFGCRPGNPFLYRIPAQGARPMTFAARGLPDGLNLDTGTGIITGTAPARGEHVVRLRARNLHGKTTREFRIISGDTLALTPPMGWNHWYAHYDRITDAMVREAADLLISSGMADAGYNYVNIDDCWMNAPEQRDPLRAGPLRDASGRLKPNQHFPDMRALADYIHNRGLKAGIYTSPGPLTCGNFAGSYEHEAVDARTFAEWGFDFLKYDWCSYGRVASGEIASTTDTPTWPRGDSPLAVYGHPYRLMGDLLKHQNRDILYNLCQYGMGSVWEWGESVGAQSWRTAGDLGFELDRIFEVALRNASYRAWSRPGSWNDPDYLQIGWVGNARGGGLPRPCPLSSNEQYAYMSLWALMASPLIYSGDLTKLDAFTLNVLCNPEVIEINQDPLGQCAATFMITETTFLMAKDLEDGSKALGLFNDGEFPADVTASWQMLGLRGRQEVRDLWRQKDLGPATAKFGATLPRRSGMLVRLTPFKGR